MGQHSETTYLGPQKIVSAFSSLLGTFGDGAVKIPGFFLNLTSLSHFNVFFLKVYC